MKPPAILIVDDHFFVRKGVRELVAAAFPEATLGDAADGSEGWEMLMKSDWNVVVLDINMPGRGGLDLLRSIKLEKPRTAVIVLTMCPEDQFAVRVLRNGASAFLTKEGAGPELIDAIKAALNGRKYINGSVAERLAQHVEQDSLKAPHELLSDREYRVMCLIGGGKTVKEISGELFLSVKTVSTYRVRLLKKMNLSNNAEIMRYAMQQRLVDLEVGLPVENGRPGSA